MSGQIHKATHTVGVRRAGSLTKRFLTFIDEDDFPCVGAKAALSRGALRTAEFSTLGDPANDRSLLAVLTDFAVMIGAGDYPEMQKATRARDRALQGSVNPNLADFGVASEARQYSGREMGNDWQCP